jgi:hypothetical protein
LSRLPPEENRRVGLSFNQKDSSLWDKIGSTQFPPALLFAIVIVIAIIARLSILLPGNLFITDEAFYLGSGVEIFQDHFASAKHYHQYTTGSVYIFPLIAAIAGAFCERIGIAGIVGVRLFNIAVNTITIVFVYKTAGVLADRWIDNPYTRKWMPAFAACIFGMSSCVLYIGALGTYDALSVGFLAFGIWRLIKSLFPPEMNQEESAIASGKDFRRSVNAAAAGIAVALGMITRFYPVVFTPLIAFIAIASVVFFTYDRIQRKRFNRTAFLLIIFVIAFLAVYGSYFISCYTTAIKPSLGHNQGNIEKHQVIPAYNLIAHVFYKYRLETIMTIIGAIWLAIPCIKKSVFRNEAIAEPVRWDRLATMASFILIPIGGIAFQIVGPHNHFAYTKNLSVAVLAMAPLAGFAAAKLIEHFPKRVKWLCWAIGLWLIGGYVKHSIRLAKDDQIFGGLNNSDLAEFLKKQLSDPDFNRRRLQFQSEAIQFLLYLAVILIGLAIVITTLKLTRRNVDKTRIIK